MKKIVTLLAALAMVMSMNALTYNVEVPEGTKACYIAGEMTSWGHTEMTKVDDTHYTIEIADATEAMKYKYSSGPDWKYVEKNEDGSEKGDRTYTANDVVVKWAVVYDPDVVVEKKDMVYNVTVPAGTKACYIAGNMTSWGHKEMTKVDDTHYTITLTAAIDDAYKYSSGPSWDYVEMQADGVTDVTDRIYSENDVVAAWKAVYDPEGGEGGDPNPGTTKTIYLVPEQWASDNAKFSVYSIATETFSDFLTSQDGIHYEATVSTNSQIIFVRHDNAAELPSWDNKWNQTEDLTIPADMNCWTHKAWGSDGGKCTGEWSLYAPTTSLDNIAIENKATKIIRNGQMYILRDGVMYNSLGQMAQ